MSPRVTRLELMLVVAVFAIGFGLRAAWPSRMAVEHFDEGVYASNLYTPEGHYPFQHLYAPPLLPFCLEWAAIFGGPHAVMWVNVVSGSLTLLVLWGMVRQWWGPPAAIAAMVLLAFNEFHIAYSRAALTDAMLGLWMTAGVWTGWRAIQFGGAVNLVAAGVLASLAWWTKYNGWLTLAVTGAGTAGWVLFGKASGGRQPPDASPVDQRSHVKTTPSAGLHRPLAGVSGAAGSAPKMEPAVGAPSLYLGRWLVTAVIAFVCWSPWLWSLQQYGGYEAVAKNHAGYFWGLSAWWSNASRQIGAVAYDQRRLTQVSLLAAAIGAFVLSLKLNRTPIDVNDLDNDFDELPWNASLSESGFWTVAAWLIGLSVAVPLYQPYPRLCLPWVLAVLICLGAQLGNLCCDESVRRRVQPVRFLLMTFSIGVCVGLLTSRKAQPTPAWESRHSLSTVATSIVTRLQDAMPARQGSDADCLLSVIAEPGLFFHLAAVQQTSPFGHVTFPSADYGLAAPGANTSGLPAYVVIGPHADQGEADRLIASGRLEQVAEFEYRPSDLVLLDSRPAWELPDGDHPVTERIRLLHVKP